MNAVTEHVAVTENTPAAQDDRLARLAALSDDDRHTLLAFLSGRRPEAVELGLDFIASRTAE